MPVSAKLLTRMIAFNMQPACYMHPSWGGTFLSPIVYDRIIGNKRARRRVSKLVLEQLNLTNSGCYDFEKPWRRFALVDSNGLTQMMYLGGLVCLHGGISRMIGGEALRSLKASIGENYYLFSVRKAPYLVGNLGIWAHPLGDPGSCMQEAESCGIDLISSLFSCEPEALTRRVLLKFPAHLSKKFSFSEESVGKTDLVILFRKILCREVDSSWATLF